MVLTNKANYMSDEAFADLKEAMEDALAFERGERRNLKLTRIQAQRSPKLSSKDRANRGTRPRVINGRKKISRSS